jgi:hypothetical protein
MAVYPNSSTKTTVKGPLMRLILRYVGMVEIPFDHYARLFNLGWRKAEIFFMTEAERERILCGSVRAAEKGGR